MVAQSPEPGVYVTNARLFKSTMDKDQTTTPRTTLTSPADQNNEDAGDGAHGLCKKNYTCSTDYIHVLVAS